MNTLPDSTGMTASIGQIPDARLPFVVAILAFLFSFVMGAQWLASIGVGAFFYYLVRLLQEAGNDIPIESFILVMASLQWIIGPTLAYAGLSDHYKFYMYVPVDRYMSLAVPGVIFLSLGLYTFRSNRRIALVDYYASLTRSIVNHSGIMPFYLIGVGLVFSFLYERFPSSLAFPVYILSNIKYIGLIYLIFSDRQKNKSSILIVAFLLTFLSSLKTGMFHDLILWSAFIGMYAAYIFRPKMTTKILLACLGIFFIFVLQAVKDEYRKMLMERTGGSNAALFLSSVDQRFDENDALSSNNVERFVIRINQGWIISRLLQVVPDPIPHAEGETVWVALKSSLLPRFLYPDKPRAGGRENFEKYTGFILQRGTSMGISLLGEGYINFGIWGAWLFMFSFGLASSYIIYRFFLLAMSYPTIWLWFPLILLHFVKAETELLTQLNYILKSIILVYAFVWANKYFLKLKL